MPLAHIVLLRHHEGLKGRRDARVRPAVVARRLCRPQFAIRTRGFATSFFE
jgi:hypothetical protein